MKTTLALANASTNNAILPQQFLSTVSQRGFSRIRLRVLIPQHDQQQPVISHLASDYGLSVNISEAQLKVNQTHLLGQFDLELTGTITQLQAGLAYLVSLDLVIQGKPNPDGDGWYC